MILINYNVVTKIVTIQSDIPDWKKDLENIEKVSINQSNQHVTFNFTKEQETSSSSLIVLPDSKKLEFTFSTNLPYLYTEDQYEVI